jgi:hypothetical protein
METLGNAMFGLLAVWGAVTAVLICILIYRSALSNREEDQIFLCAAQEFMAADQRALVARIERLTLPIRVLMVASGGLLTVIGVLTAWDIYKRF